MICVSIGRSRHKHMLAEHKHLVEAGAKLVELRLDYISSRVNIQRLLKDRPCATVIMLREAIANGVEYVDLEDDIAGQIPRFGKTKRIISYHSFRNTPDNLRELHNKMKVLDADIVKIATMANQPHDNLRVLEMMQESDCPTIGMCMGDIGRSLARLSLTQHFTTSARWRRANSAMTRWSTSTGTTTLARRRTCMA
jgi:3-dehydroquinate dehydratase/shikimate dehydrogenase